MSLAASVVLPNGDLWVTGGYENYNAITATTDIIGKDLNITEGPPLPKPLANHCVTQWNSTHLIVAGGYEPGNFTSPFTNETYSIEIKRNAVELFNIETNEWTVGPNMNSARASHSCTTFVGNEMKIKKTSF